jgi:hypothetical protein
MNLATKTRLNLLFAFCFLLPLLFLFSNIHADAFKCIDKKGNTIFQDSECGENRKETKITIKKHTRNSQCLVNCEASRRICVADLGLGERNTGRGLLLCENAKQACDTHCYNPTQGRELEVFTAIERSSYERELRHKQALKNEARYKKTRKERAEKRELKTKQRRCNKYKRKLAKVKARWKRTQEQAQGWTPKEEDRYRRWIENSEDEVRIECQ